MALLIDINKIKQTELYVRYKYNLYSTPDNFGILEINLQNEKVTEVQQAPGDNHKILFNRVAMKIAQHWRQGEFPDKTCWAS